MRGWSEIEVCQNQSRVVAELLPQNDFNKYVMRPSNDSSSTADFHLSGSAKPTLKIRSGQ